MPQKFLNRHHHRLWDHRHIVTSHFDRESFRFALASMLAVCIILSALPSSSRADRVAQPSGKGRTTMAVQRQHVGAGLRARPSLGNVAPDTTPGFQNGATTEGRPYMKSQSVALRLLARPSAGNVAPDTTPGFQTGATTEGRPYMKSGSVALGLHATPGFQTGATTEGRPYMKSVSAYVANLKASGAGLFGSTRKVFSITPSPDLSTKTQAGGFEQSQGDGTGRSSNLGALSYTSGDAPIVSSSYPAITSPAITSPVKMTRSAAVTGTPSVSDGAESTTSDRAPDAKSQQADDAPGKPQAKSTIKTEAKITIQAEGRGFPNVNFQDGRELPVSAQEPNTAGAQEPNPTPPTVMASADFDSDGVPDLVTAGPNGTLRLYRGNVDSIYPNSPQAKQRRANGTFVDSPFYPSEKSFSLGTTPDFLEVGDFNADGRKDVLALTKDDSRLQILWGDGHGNFSAPFTVLFSGKATALAVGEIGRRDGQTDVAVAVVNGKTAQLLVFEHPEGAFKHKPEIFVLPSAATDLTIGHLDKDSYGDVAIASGNNLTIVHGRGQAYPLDLKADLNIKRPAAFKQTRQLGFEIAALAIGRFTGSRGDSLAVLANDGSIYTLEPDREVAESAKIKPTAAELQRTKKVAFIPAGVESGSRKLAALKVESPRTEQEADQNGLLMADSRLSRKDREEFIREKLQRSAADFARLPRSEQDRITAEKLKKTEANNQQRKEGLERTLSSRPLPLAAFKIATLISDPRLVSAAHSIVAHKLITARVSDSDKADLVLVDSIGRQIHVIAQIKPGGQSQRTELISLDSEAAPLSVLPMRLNTDALSDLVVLRENSASPSVLITAPAQTFVVNTTDDNSSGPCDGTVPCSLRQAMFLVNTGVASAMITFNIGGGGVQTIHPLSELPDMNHTVTIDGTTQPGYIGTPIIEIKGDLVSGAIDGMSLTTSNSVIRGLVINEFPFSNNDDGSVTGGSGIVIFSTTSSPNVGNNIVEGNYLGTDPTGTLDKGNQATGLSIFDADDNTIGGTSFLANNVMSGNGDFENTNVRGVGLAITAGNRNQIKGNFIGTDANGSFKISNTYGVFFTGINNQFGGDEAGAGNLVSGNGTLPVPGDGRCHGGGINVDALIDLETGEVVTDENTIKGNLIGTNFNGTAPLGNCETGIGSFGNLNTFIGSITQSGRNTISDNGYDGIQCGFNSSFLVPMSGACYIVGNNVGTDVTGNVAIPNDQRNGCSGFCLVSDTVWVPMGGIDFAIVGSPGGTTPGGACTGFCNLVSGNYSLNLGGGGVFHAGFGTALVVNNYLGVNRAGTAALPNNFGFWSYYGGFVFGAALSDGNGGFVDGGNLASGNAGAGVYMQTIDPGATFEIKGNLVGTSSDGVSGVPNGIGNTEVAGIGFNTSPGTELKIGGTNPLERNVIAATVSDSAYSGSRGYGISANFNNGSATVINNYIGVNKFLAPLGNSGSGITAGNGDGFLRIGGIGPNEANVIRSNGAAGVFVFRFGTGPGRNVSIRGNSIVGNGGLGIDLAKITFGAAVPDGLTPNDCYDDDDGGNNLQNFPILLAPVFNADFSTTISGTLRSTPSRTFFLDFYSNLTADPSDYGEGETYLGNLSVATDGNGFVAFTFNTNEFVSVFAQITATATDGEGNTSEFSCYAGHCTEAEQNCLAGIVVNIDSDEPDANTADGVCDVDTGTPGLQCSLRAAIQEANARSGKDHINFDIPGAGVHKILVTTALPIITEKVDINATTQPGFVATPLVEIDGSSAGTLGKGLVLTGGSSTIRGLAINRFNDGTGILINSSENSVEQCHIGIDPDGVNADPSRPLRDGVSVVNGNKNLIGGRNAIGNFTHAGVLLSGGVQETKVQVNRIGMSAVGSQPLGAGTYGVLITSGAQNNTIGGDLLHGNIISGSLMVGIALDGTVSSNIIKGNRIGTDQDGNFSPFTHGDTGILIKGGAANNTIGGTPDERNVIGGNDRTETSSGIHIEASAATTNKILGNYIGINQDGNARAGNSIGVLIDRSGVTIGGDKTGNPNVISGNINFGIQIQGETSALSDITISYNLIGTDSSGFFSNFMGNTVGVLIAGQVQDAKIKNNTISGNQTGVDISLGATATVSANFIGTDFTGVSGVPNEIGIAVVQTSDCSIKDNIVSGNRIGILVGDGIGPDPDPKSPQAQKLQKFYARHPRPNGATVFTERISITHNQIGLDLTGSYEIGNRFAGIAVGENARNNTIGGSISGIKYNTISGSTGDADNAGYGIFIGTRTEQPASGALPSNNLVQGNRIGLTPDQEAVVVNKVGIYLSKAENNFIGGGKPTNKDTPNTANTIAGSLEDGVRIVGPLTQNNVIVNNFIGVTRTGIDVGNEGNGVAIIDAPNNRVGVVPNEDNEVGSSNVIAANHLNGILVEGGESHDTNIFGNTIGLFRSPTETIAMGNGENGVKLMNANNVAIGGTSEERRNFIGGNLGAGILIAGGGSAFNSVKNNVIGTDENNTPNLGNAGDGVLINSQAGQNHIGGPEENAGNTITGNGGAGVRIDSDAGCCNLVDPNSIYGNTGLGIDSGSLGNTLNDPGDADSGPNNLQNYPEFAQVIINNGFLVFFYWLDSMPGNSNYGVDGIYVEFFKADASLQGKTFLGSTHYTVADYNNGIAPGLAGFSVGNAASLGVQDGDKIVATATDADGNTSEFTFANVGVVVTQPTAAKLESFSATAHDDSVLLNWKTGFEVDNLGFNVYRDVDGVRTKITPQVVAGSALSDGPGTSLLSGHNYYWTDTPPAGKSVRYWLEDIDLRGKSTFNGPYSITGSSSGSAADAQKQSELISQIGMRQGVLANGLGSTPVTRGASLAPASATAVQAQIALASQPAVKIAVRQEGYYRVTQAEVLRAGLDPKADPRQLQLFVDGVEQPIKVPGEQDGRLDANDAIEFYGVGLDSASTDTRVYWLIAGAKPGKRIAVTKGKGDPVTSGSFPFTVERKDRTIYFSALRNGEAENFFGAVVASQPVDQSLWIQHLDQTSHSPASLEVSLQGVTKLAHNVRVQLNGTDVTRLSFTDQTRGTRLVSVSQSLLREGENQVRLIAEGGPSDVSLVDVIRISYSHSYVADSDALRLTAQANQQVNVSGFTRNDIRLMDVTNANAPQEIAATVTGGKNGYTVSGAAAGSDTRAVLAFADSQARRPWSITANQPSSLSLPGNGADLLIITQRNYFSPIAALKSLRESQGLSVAVVDIEDIYDEFSFGDSSPQAIKDFSAYAARTWKKKPRFVLLAGDASYDPKNYLGLGDFDLVPTKLLDTAYMETASDDWFADFDNDGVPELAVGRLPFRNAAEASTMIAKIIGYERSSPSDEVLLVADSNDGFDFEGASGELAATIPPSLRINQIHRGTDTAAAKARLMGAINRGQKLVNYAGHGSANQWRGNLLVNEDASQMKNADHLSVFVMMTCLNGYFDDPVLESLAESLLKAERGGAVAVWSSSGMTLPGDQARMNQGLYKSMFSGKGSPLLGDAVREAKAASGDVDIRRTWVLLGDPTMRLR